MVSNNTVLGYWNNTPTGTPGSYKTWVGVNGTFGLCGPVQFYMTMGMFSRLSWTDAYDFCLDNDCNGTVSVNTTNE